MPVFPWESRYWRAAVTSWPEQTNVSLCVLRTAIRTAISGAPSESVRYMLCICSSMAWFGSFDRPQACLQSTRCHTTPVVSVYILRAGLARLVVSRGAPSMRYAYVPPAPLPPCICHQRVLRSPARKVCPLCLITDCLSRLLVDTILHTNPAHRGPFDAGPYPAAHCHRPRPLRQHLLR